MEKLYANIGEKIKKLAFVSFIVEAIAFVIGGIAICAEGDIEGLGISMILFGPVVAFVGSWLLYGFGELISSSNRLENQNSTIISLLSNNGNRVVDHKESTPSKSEEQKPEPKSKEQKPEPKSNSNIVPIKSKTSNMIICPACKYEQPSNRKVCWQCGVAFANNEPPAPHICDNCGKEGPFATDKCPNCDSTIK